MTDLERIWEQLQAAVERGEWSKAEQDATAFLTRLRSLREAKADSCEFCPAAGGGCIVCNPVALASSPPPS